MSAPWDNLPDSCLPAAALDLNTYAPDARGCVIGHPFRSEADCVLPEDWDHFLCRRCVEAAAHETWPESEHAASLQAELDRLEREDPAVQAAAASLDAVGEDLKGRLPSSVVADIYDPPVLRDKWDMDDDERSGR